MKQKSMCGNFEDIASIFSCFKIFAAGVKPSEVLAASSFVSMSFKTLIERFSHAESDATFPDKTVAIDFQMCCSQRSFLTLTIY